MHGVLNLAGSFSVPLEPLLHLINVVGNLLTQIVHSCFHLRLNRFFLIYLHLFNPLLELCNFRPHQLFRVSALQLHHLLVLSNLNCFLIKPVHLNLHLVKSNAQLSQDVIRRRR
jgi:hypothetical protein